jgi:lipopolysaccharide export system permease protein
MAYAEGQTDLSLRLFDGAIHQFRPAEPQTFQLTYYHVNDIRVRNVFDELERNTSESVRGDREMSTCEMLRVIHGARNERVEATRDRRELLVTDLRRLLELPPIPATSPGDSAWRPPRYCGWIQSVYQLILPRTAEAQGPAQGKAPAAMKPKVPPVTPALQPVRPKPATAQTRMTLTNWSQVATAIDRMKDANQRADRYLVEVHKKWAISLACISFVIIGIVMALRFPRGGIGLVIGGGLAVFSIHYVGLTAGESLADRGLMSPWLAMWAPNIILTIIGVLGLIRVSRESGSTRGGDFQEVLDGIRHMARRIRRRFRPKEA